MNWGFKNARTNETLVDAILEAIVSDLAILENIKDVPAFLFNGVELTYETTVKKLNSAKRYYDSEIAAGKLPAALEGHKKRIDSLTALVSAIRDLTILHAIKTDDEVLFGRLKEIGADPSAFLGVLGDNKLPSFLLKDSNIKLKAWYKEQRRLGSTELSVSSVSLFDNLERLEKLKTAADDINSAHAAREAALLEQAAVEREARMSAASLK